MGDNFGLRSQRKSPHVVLVRCWPRVMAAASQIVFLLSSNAAETQAADFADLTLDQLSDIEITSVSKHTERLSDAAASIYVISAEDKWDFEPKVT